MLSRGIDALVREHSFFAGMPAEAVALVAGCGRNVRIPFRELLARHGERADAFFAVRNGSVAVEIQAPQGGTRILQTIGPGEIVGWSWLFPPYAWDFDVRALEEVRAVRFDGACLRAKCEENPALGYDLMKRFATVFSKRLYAARLQLLDLYGGSGGGG